MEYTVHNLSTFMQRCQRQYEVGANNLANTSTHGFKKELVAERGLYQGTRVNLSQGTLIDTGNKTDLAIKGNGFFVIKTDQGGRYTRNGNFQVDAQGRLVNKAGQPVLDDKGREITPGENMSVTQNGTVFSGNEPVAKLAVVNPRDPKDVKPLGSGLFNFEPGFTKPDSYSIENGFLEGSNVDTLREMSDSINFIRNFELAQRVMKMAQDLGERCATEIANTGN